LIAINLLWKKVYPYTAAQIMQAFGCSRGNALEMGSFAGGISMEIARLYPQIDLTIADERTDYLEFLKKKMISKAVAKHIKLVNTPLDNLTFNDNSFDLVILRGAFFFIMERPKILAEIFRVLNPGGLAFVGGGYGKGIPQSLIDEISAESRILNDRLGRHRVRIDELQQLLLSQGLDNRSHIVEEGGVWLEIRK
jgi:ubiquinone/menaquinone biosynthesis C-methylase UbiE